MLIPFLSANTVLLCFRKYTALMPKKKFGGFPSLCVCIHSPSSKLQMQLFGHCGLPIIMLVEPKSKVTFRFES